MQKKLNIISLDISGDRSDSGETCLFIALILLFIKNKFLFYYFIHTDLTESLKYSKMRMYPFRSLYVYTKSTDKLADRQTSYIGCQMLK